ncbi:prepilin-type N-terminal cleavage/methylation domain-containing protein [Bacillus sp. 1P06AnD]|uniref:prepilin-type N-terminal cleavage/methylation domain-containing protein n=1 Tax=Bacillus sp. 1P06AnD TaxID=3132208 RepID=UPI0039A1C412
MKRLKEKLRDILNNERGLTLIELLAVVVILAIIAAIAIPSIGGLMDNTKKDAHVANAEQMISAARMAVTADQELTTGKHYYSLKRLIDEKYLEKIKDPDKGTYDEGTYTKDEEVPVKQPESGSYVEVDGGQITAVKLVNKGGKKVRGVQTEGGAPIVLIDPATTGSGNKPATEEKAHDLTRKDVNEKKDPS